MKSNSNLIISSHPQHCSAAILFKKAGAPAFETFANCCINSNGTFLSLNELLRSLTIEGALASILLVMPVYFLDEAADSDPRIHQALKTINNLVVTDKYRTDLDGSVTTIGREAGSFKVKNDNTIIVHIHRFLT